MDDSGYSKRVNKSDTFQERNGFICESQMSLITLELDFPKSAIDPVNVFLSSL